MVSGVKNTLYNTITTIVLVMFGLSTSIMIARVLGPSDKGVFNFFVIIVSISISVFQFGFGAGSLYSISSEKFKIKEVFLTSLITTFFIGFLTSSIIVLFFWLEWIPIFSKNIKTNKFILLMILPIIESMYRVVVQLLTGSSLFGIVNRVNLLNAGLFLMLLLALYIVNRFTLEFVLFVYLFQRTIVFIGFLTVVIIKIRPVVDVNLKYANFCFSYGLKSWVGNISNQANAKMDQVLIGFFLTSGALGVYNVGYSIINYLETGFTGFHKVFFNKVAQFKDEKLRLSFFLQMHRIMLVICVFISIAMALLSKYFIVVIYGNDYADSYYVILILLVGVIPYFSTRRMVQKFFSAKGQPFTASMIEIVTSVSGLLLYVVLIPYYGMLGAASATSIAFLIGTVYALIMFMKNESSVTFTDFFVLKFEDFLYFKKVIKRVKGVK